MFVVWRIVVWSAAVLSTAVLWHQALGGPVLSVLARVLEAYAGAVAIAARMIEPALMAPLAAVTPGAKLYPHWPHVLLLVTLQMMPPLPLGERRFVEVFQVAAGVVLAIVISAIVGTAPFASGRELADFVAVFTIAAAFAVNIGDEFAATGASDDEAWRVYNERRTAFSALGILVMVSGLAVGAIAAIFGLAKPTDLGAALVIVTILSLVAGFIGSIIDAIRNPPPRMGRGFLEAPLVSVARLGLLAGGFLLISHLSHVYMGDVRQASDVIIFGVVVVALFSALLLDAFRTIVLKLADDGERAPPPPSALGMAIAGAGLLLLGDYALRSL